MTETNKKRRVQEGDVRIGRLIRARRLEMKVSQEQLADSLGISFQQVQKYEKGQNRVSGGTLETIARKLQVPVSFFFEARNTVEGNSSDLFAFINTSAGVRIARAFQKIEDRDLRASVVAMVEAAAAK